MPGSPEQPVEQILKISLDKSGADGVTQWLDHVESRTQRIVGHLEQFGRGALGLAGIAGVGALINDYMHTATSGSQLALAAGHVTGGMGAWKPYTGALYSAQRQTGVDAGAIGQGLVQAIQQVGGNPSPQQAAVLGGLLAGYGNTVGMSPSQVSQIVAPILQASNKPLNSGSMTQLMATLSGGLSNMPGSQAAIMLPQISQLAQMQMMGAGPGRGYMPDVRGLTAMANTAVGASGVWRSQFGGAASSVVGGLQNAYGNPAMEAFLQEAGIGYNEQRDPTASSMLKLSDAATAQYGTGITRDLALRGMFGINGADLLEQFAPGTHAHKALDYALRHPHAPGAKQLLNQIHHAQAATTPQATQQKITAAILGWINQHPMEAAAAGLGGLAAKKLIPKALGKGAGLLGRGARKLLGRGATTAAEDAAAAAGGDAAEKAGGSLLGDLLGGTASKVLGPLGVVAGALISADPAGSPVPHGRRAEQLALSEVIHAAEQKFGRKGMRSMTARDWMQKQLYGTMFGDGDNRFRLQGGTLKQSGQDLDRALGIHWGSGSSKGGKDPVDTFSDASKAMLAAAQTLERIARRSGFVSYNPQSSNWLGVGGVQQVGASAPGMEFASLTGGGSNSTAFASFTGQQTPQGGSGGGGQFVSAPKGGGQACILTWYDPALGGINGGGQYADGGTYHASDMACAAPPAYAFGTMIDFTYGGKTIRCKVRDRGGAIVGNHFDLTRGAAQMLGIISAGRVTGTFTVVSGGSGGKSSGGQSGGGSLKHTPGGVFAAGDHASSGAGAVALAANAGTAGHPASSAPGTPGQGVTHIHVHIDGREVRRARLLRGHH